MKSSMEAPRMSMSSSRVAPNCARRAAIRIGDCSTGSVINVAATVSTAAKSVPTMITPILRGVPPLGPGPSIPMTASTIARAGWAVLLMSMIKSAKASLSWKRKC